LSSLVFRYSLPILVLALSGKAGAVGLGELRGQPVLGQGLQLEVSLLGAEKLALDASCFRLVQPSDGGELPWLKKASLNFRRGSRPVLEIRSVEPLREPILQMAIQLGCGHEISRDYVLMASPVMSGIPQSEMSHPTYSEVTVPSAVRRPAAAPSAEPRLPAAMPARRASKPKREVILPDRLVLSAESDVGDPSLRLATSIVPERLEATDAQREIFRLEYRMLMALHDQATTQLATAEKLRNMEGALGELQERATLFAQRVEQGGGASGQPPASGAQPVQSAVEPTVQGPPQAQPVSGGSSQIETSEGYSDWGLYGILLGAALGLAGWLVWRNQGIRSRTLADAESTDCEPEIKVDPRRSDEHEEPGGVDLPFEPAAMGMPMRVDFEIGPSGEAASVAPITQGQRLDKISDSVMSINATTLDEHFEANPVMELADIMLSFGRVKGAAQALQEYIDNNPQEALRPWIRLMDVYRMAGMRVEFEKVAHNLNQHFNVEVQSWDDGKSGMEFPAPTVAEVPVAPRPQSLEDLPRLMNTVIELWDAGDVVGYLYQLLRDNRGGQRLGFALPVVEDVLFLIELKETANRMENVQ
jgi:pilus assembly protein FimV